MIKQCEENFEAMCHANKILISRMMKLINEIANEACQVNDPVSLFFSVQELDNLISSC